MLLNRFPSGRGVRRIAPIAIACAIALSQTPAADAAVQLIAVGSLNGSSAGTNADLSGLTGTLENGMAANILGGIGSGLAYAGGNTFIGLPDRGPNATAYVGGDIVNNTTSYIDRFHTIEMSLTATPSGSLPYTLTPTLTSTTLMYSNTALTYGSSVGSGVPALNQVNGNYYFTGRSDGFNAGGTSLNVGNARLDPEAVRISNDGKSLFVSDEYGPYVYQFDRATGERIRTFNLPDHFGVANQSSQEVPEINGNTSGRVANKGMEGLAITPDGKTLVGFVQSPLIQDGGDGGRANRIVTIDVATGATHEYAYDNRIGSSNRNSSEILAVNDHQFLVLERDGKGLGDGSNASVKQVYLVDLAGAQDVSGLSGEAALLAQAPGKTQFLDIRTALNALGIADSQIPAKLEGMAFGQDVTINGEIKHTLYIANDNDFVANIAGGNNFYVFAFGDSDLSGFRQQEFAPVPLPGALPLFGSALAAFAAALRRRRQQS